MRKFSKPAVDMADYVLPIELGGTGAATLAGAATSLKLVTNSMKNQPNGPISLGADGKFAAANLPALAGTNQVNIQGSFLVAASEVKTWTITDYDSKKNYNPTVSAGTISQNGATLTYTAPASPVAVNFTIGGRVIQFNVMTTIPTQPTISTPASGSTNVALISQFTASAFSNTGAVDTHASSDWQLSSDSAFNTIVSSVTADVTNKTTWTPPKMPLSTTLYARVRYKGASGNYGAWSSAVVFNTTSISYAGNEEAKLTASTPRVASDFFGYSISISNDGSRCVVGANSADNGSFVNNGSAFVFSRSGTTWSLEQKILPTDSVEYAQFGQSADISGDGSRIIIGATFATASVTASAGAAYIFSRSGTTWTQEAKLISNAPGGSRQFGISVSITDDGTRCAVGEKSGNYGTVTNGGVSYVFLRTGTTWASEVILSPSTLITAAQFGSWVSISGDGIRLAVGANNDTQNSQTQAGSVYIFSRSGTTWTQEAKLTAPAPFANQYFGTCVSLNTDSTRLAIGCNGPDATNFAVYVYLRSGTNWTIETTIRSSDGLVDDLFGSRLDFNQDGSRLIVGARVADPSGNNNAGACYLFGRTNTTWSQLSKLTASDMTANYQFGSDVCISRDSSHIAVGSVNVTVSAVLGAGAAYVYA